MPDRPRDGVVRVDAEGVKVLLARERGGLPDASACRAAQVWAPRRRRARRRRRRTIMRCRHKKPLPNLFSPSHLFRRWRTGSHTIQSTPALLWTGLSHSVMRHTLGPSRQWPIENVRLRRRRLCPRATLGAGRPPGGGASPFWVAPLTGLSKSRPCKAAWRSGIK